MSIFKRPHNNRVPGAIIGLLLTLALAGCNEPESAAPAAPPPAVSVALVIAKEINPVSDRIGRTEAIETVDLRARVEGFLESQNFKNGADVEKGSVLYQIEQAPYIAQRNAAKAALAQATAAHRQAQQFLKRLKSVRTGGVSPTDMDAAFNDELQRRAQVQEAQANLETAELNLSYTKIIAPISGRIGRTAVTPGNLVGPDSGVLATIVKLDSIYVAFTVPEQRIITTGKERLRLGLSQDEFSAEFIPRLRLSDGTIYEHEGRDNFLDNQVADTTGTVTIRSTFPNPERLLLPGQFVSVLTERDRPVTQQLVPQAAIQQDQAGHYVLVVNDQKQVVRRPVEVGERYGTDWAIKDGVDVGELVIFQGIEKVRPGVPVNPTVVALPKPVEG